MNKYRLPGLTLIFILIISSKNGQAQTDTFLQSAIKNTVLLYNQYAAEQSALYNGSEYKGYDPGIKGDAYFQSGEFTKGTLLYDGGFYENLLLLYDVVTDQVITPHFNKIPYIALVSNKVQEFSFLNQKFIHITPDSTNKGVIVPGFYNVLFEGRAGLLARRVKTIQESVSQEGVTKEFIANNNYFIRKNGTYHSITSESAMLAVLNDHKKELQQFLKSSNIRFKKDPEQALIRTVQYYNALVP